LQQDKASCEFGGEMSEIEKKREPVTAGPTEDAERSGPLRETVSNPHTPAPGAKERHYGAVAETIRRELMARFSGCLSMEQISDCAHALAVTISQGRNSRHLSGGSNRPTRGIFQRPPRSGIYWISYFDAEGKRHREKIGPQRAAAVDALSQRRREVKEGRYIPPRAGSRITFRELASAAMAQKKLRLAPLSYETDRLRLEQLLPLIGNAPADRLTPNRLEEILARLISMKASSGSTANRYRSLLSSIFSFAVRSGKMTTNPVSRVKRFRENESRLRWLKPDEEKALREAIDSDLNRAEFDLALHTGMRRGEQFDLQWKDVDLERGNLTVRGKTGRRHVVANSSAIAALRKLQEATGSTNYVCQRDAEQKRDLRTWFERARDKAGIEDFRFHDIRHTFASRLVMAGVDIRTVQELLGHKSIVMTMRYAHLAQDHRQSAVEKMAEAAA
jgi:integrase